ncbi:hypothetical protein [Anaerotignum sp.]|uniref:hypothetical protein n=1 Tax=Anaerotignum sp. TaxID=2039241 RepID=UPI002A90AB8D|nr:hypothetical protein [Anaerotignum sp.]MCI7656379.1 hypothetical protein [Clostridia bacterium]MDY5416131.1 hypothetical protein [Anaerotignum sp.]
MDFLLLLAFGYLLYGIVGLLGFQKIPEVHRDKPWTKAYIRWQAVSWILMALPLLVYSFYFSSGQCILSLGKRIWLLLMLFVPTIIFEVIRSRKFSRLLKGEKEQEKAEKDGDRQ